MCAEDLLETYDDTIRARQMIDRAEEFFPATNFPTDKYCVYQIKILNDLYGHDRAAVLWDGIYDYYLQDITYLSQFRGKFAEGVRRQLREDVQIVGQLMSHANDSNPNRNILHDAARAEKAQALFSQYQSFL